MKDFPRAKEGRERIFPIIPFFFIFNILVGVHTGEMMGTL